MVRVRWMTLALLLSLALSLAGCAASAPQAAPSAAPAAAEDGALPAGSDGSPMAVPAADSAGGEGLAAAEPSEVNLVASPPQDANRKIIKNGELRLAVKDTDVAVGRTTQIAADVGGYILSSRAWTQDDTGRGEPLHYASITLSVPSDRFEETINRLRGLAVHVLDETAAGEDVTDQFVDLQSQLKNYQATRDRIRGFLDQAQTVEEALKVNEQLAAVEAEIERIQGQINYLGGRSAFSTIAVNLEPDLPPVVAAPAPVAEVWSARATFTEASAALQIVAQRFADLLIWFGVVILPFILLLLLVAWPIWRFWPRMR